ncbi:hypothetical protein HK105_201205 [Polyrhizophydium stewartii]|uniref:Peptidase A2 domain-containing protein n=1 Tax=Polyrhizophydium stewartii TaxID=2732419 RepID=A0ABR4NJ68_9FUNG
MLAEAADNYAENLRILEENPALMLAAVQLYKAGKLAGPMPTPGVATPATTQEDDELTAFFESDTVRPGSSVSTALPFPGPGQWPGPPFRLPTVDPPPSEPRRVPTSTYQTSSVASMGPIAGRPRPLTGSRLMLDPQVAEMMRDPLSNALELGTMVQTPKPDASQAKLAQGLALREDVITLPAPDLDDSSPAGFEATLRATEAITELTNNVVMAVEEHLTAQVIRTSWPKELLKSLYAKLGVPHAGGEVPLGLLTPRLICHTLVELKGRAAMQRWALNILSTMTLAASATGQLTDLYLAFDRYAAVVCPPGTGQSAIVGKFVDACIPVIENFQLDAAQKVAEAPTLHEAYTSLIKLMSKKGYAPGASQLGAASSAPSGRMPRTQRRHDEATRLPSGNRAPRERSECIFHPGDAHDGIGGGQVVCRKHIPDPDLRSVRDHFIRKRGVSLKKVVRYAKEKGLEAKLAIPRHLRWYVPMAPRQTPAVSEVLTVELAPAEAQQVSNPLKRGHADSVTASTNEPPPVPAMSGDPSCCAFSASVNGWLGVAQIDTGSDINVVSRAFARTAGLKAKRDERGVRARSFNGQYTKLEWTCEFTVRVGDYERRVVAFVSDMHSTQIILGKP